MKSILASVARILGALALILAACVFLFWFFYSRHLLGAAAYDLSAETLSREFREDEVSASAKYAGEVISVTGPYVTSGVSLGRPWILIGAKIGLGGISGVQCFFRDLDAAAAVPKRENLSLRGRVTGKIGYVQLENCKLGW